MKLTHDQQRIFDLVESTEDNYLITGKPGTGKSVLTRALLSYGQKSYIVAAPTGLAALNAMGRTLHSIFRIPIADTILFPDYNEFTRDEKTVNFIRYGVKHLIIDEISMVRADALDYINRLLQEVKGNSLPFGGIQVIFIGDFFQLPPVVKAADKKQLLESGYNSEFCFDSKVWEETGVKLCELTEVLRQKDDLQFMKILHSARLGNLNLKQLEVVNKQVGKTDGLRIVLCGINKDADAINQARLKALPDQPHVFYGRKFGEWPALPAEEQLTLKVGAQVMVKVNRADRPPDTRGEFGSKVVNGTIGIVHSLNSDTASEQPPFVEIKLEGGELVKIYIKRWERKIRKRNEDGKWEEQVVASYEQIPLALAWAISMHKSQGQTFDKVHIDANRIFAAGQLYVALSRCRTLDGISLQRPLTSSKFFTNSRVLQFMRVQKNVLS